MVQFECFVQLGPDWPKIVHYYVTNRPDLFCRSLNLFRNLNLKNFEFIRLCFNVTIFFCRFFTKSSTSTKN